MPISAGLQWVLGLALFAQTPIPATGPNPEGPSVAVRDADVEPAQVPGPPPAAGPISPSTGPVAQPPAAAQPAPGPGGSAPSAFAPGFAPAPMFYSPLGLSAAPWFPSAPPADQEPAGPGLTSLDRFSLVGIPQMLGDLAPISGQARLGTTAAGANVVRLPWVRGYKMADNQSPRPLDRVYVAFNFFDDLNVGNPSFAGLRDVRIYREYFGIEKTFFDGNASINLRLPVNSISARGTLPGLGGSSTAVGDLSILAKFALWQDRTSGDIVSAGMGIGTPTGPSAFAGASYARAPNPPFVQPFVGFIKTFGYFYTQGFTAIDVPFDSNVVTMYYNDLAMGYYFRAPDPDWLITAVAPSMEVHVNTPLNHRGGFSSNDPSATVDSVNLTFGLTAVTQQRTMISVGLVEPVTGPRPFSGELVVLVNFFFGRTRRAPAQPPFLGGG